MNPTMTYMETLIVTHCWCGIAVGVPETLYNHAKNDSRNDVYCPLGHVFVFREDYKTKYERERKRVEATRDLLQAEERSHVATKGHLTRARRRAAAGVCPCCHRHFADIQRHVASKHPDFDPAAAPS